MQQNKTVLNFHHVGGRNLNEANGKSQQRNVAMVQVHLLLTRHRSMTHPCLCASQVCDELYVLCWQLFVLEATGATSVAIRW